MPRRELTQDVLVAAAVERDEQLGVSVYGTAENLCGTIAFDLPDPDERRRVAGVIGRWARSDEPLSMVARGDTITLVADRALLARALSGPAPDGTGRRRPTTTAPPSPER